MRYARSGTLTIGSDKFVYRFTESPLLAEERRWLNTFQCLLWRKQAHSFLI